MNYKFGRKNNWRRWFWNAIKERLAVPASEAVVVYLGGESDLDRQIALSKGFAPHNLILIERDRQIALNHRANGKLCLLGDFFDVVTAWPCAIKPHVIAGDFVGGLNRNMFENIISLTVMPSARNAVLAFNLLAGREGTGQELFCSWKEARDDLPAGTIKSPHRGRMVWTEFLATCAEAVHGNLEIRDGRFVRGSFTEDERAEYERLFERNKPRLYAFSRPTEYRYVSESGQRFDSTVFVHPLRGAELADWREVDEKVRAWAREAYPQTMRGSINAVMAHRTMRMH